MRDLYDILEVPNNASEAWVKRAYELKKKAALADTKLSDAERDVLLRDLDKAFGVLSNPAKREIYDNPEKLRRNRSMATASTVPASGGSWKWAVGGIVALMFLGGFAFYGYTAHEMKKQRLAEEARIAEEKARYAQQLAEREEEAREKERVRQEKQAQNAEALADRRFREAVNRQQSGIARSDRDEALRAERLEREREYAERDAARRESGQSDARARYEAQAEVERQKRWLEQQQREEQRARLNRAR